MGDGIWIQQIDAMQRRMATLYRSAATEATTHDLLPVAFEELQTALEELRSMYEELCLQHDHLLNTREQIEAEFQAFQDLFAQAPVAYLVTSLNGTIRQANLAAAALFFSAEKFMVGRSLALFVPEGERRAFRERLAQLHVQIQHPQTWEMRLQPWRGSGFHATLTVAFARGPLGRPTAIRWIIQDAVRLAQNQDQAIALHAG
jgi:PAS domain S-box-containing protein